MYQMWGPERGRARSRGPQLDGVAPGDKVYPTQEDCGGEQFGWYRSLREDRDQLDATSWLLPKLFRD